MLYFKSSHLQLSRRKTNNIELQRTKKESIFGEKVGYLNMVE